MGKSTLEIHDKLEGEQGRTPGRIRATLAGVITQIFLMNVVFSLDSLITAIGVADRLSIMVIAVVIAVLAMMVFAGPVTRIVDCHPTLKILALSFLILIGVGLIGEGLDLHIAKG